MAIEKIKDEIRNIDILKEDIKSNKLKKLYLLYGPEEYLIKYYLDSMEKGLLDPAYASMNKIIIEGKVDAPRLEENCDAMPFFSDRKLVLVKNSGLFKAKKKAEQPQTTSRTPGDAVSAYLQRLPDHACLIFIEEDIDKRIKLVDIVKKNGLVVEFPYQKPVELIKWVIKVFLSNNKEIDNELASCLVDNCEQGMNELLNEINKLILYLGDEKKVKKEHLDRICSVMIKNRIFELTDAIAARDSRQALRLLGDLLLLKEPVLRIIALITRQYRQLLNMKLMMEEKMKLEDTAARLGVAPFIAGKILKQSNCFNINELKNILNDILELDIEIKTGRIDERTGLEVLIVKYAGSTQNA